ncbi:MAG: transglutaminase domain-containing protein, partial [Isosphaeraceae bacterium]
MRPIFEAMEDRTMLNGDLVVGRVPSSWTTGGVVGNKVTVTYTVYNQSAEAMDGVQLATTLAGGVTFQDASAAPTRDGQRLTWNLGTVAPFGRASVDVTVGLASANTSTLDGETRATASVGGVAVTDTAPALTLRAGTVAAELLAKTVDADPTDPFVAGKAAELDYSVSQILAYLSDEVKFETYVGSLRGSRGTLWGNAGNALDEASLGIALLRGSGIPSRYATGPITDGQASQLIAT